MDRFRLETLAAKHPTWDFECEEDEINSYLHDEALPDMARGVALTFVEIDSEKPANANVAGFFTLRAHAVAIDVAYFDDSDQMENEISFDEDWRIERVPFDNRIEVPLVELMWLARDIKWRAQGIGALLMIDALTKVATAADCIGFIGLHLRSTSRGVRLYQRFKFQQFRQHPLFDDYRYILPIDTIREIVRRAREE